MSTDGGAPQWVRVQEGLAHSHVRDVKESVSKLFRMVDSSNASKAAMQEMWELVKEMSRSSTCLDKMLAQVSDLLLIKIREVETTKKRKAELEDETDAWVSERTTMHASIDSSIDSSIDTLIDSSIGSSIGSSIETEKDVELRMAREENETLRKECMIFMNLAKLRGCVVRDGGVERQLKIAMEEAGEENFLSTVVLLVQENEELKKEAEEFKKQKEGMNEENERLKKEQEEIKKQNEGLNKENEKLKKDLAHSAASGSTNLDICHEFPSLQTSDSDATPRESSEVWFTMYQRKKEDLAKNEEALEKLQVHIQGLKRHISDSDAQNQALNAQNQALNAQVQVLTGQIHEANKHIQEANKQIHESNKHSQAEWDKKLQDKITQIKESEKSKYAVEYKKQQEDYSKQWKAQEANIKAAIKAALEAEYQTRMLAAQEEHNQKLFEETRKLLGATVKYTKLERTIKRMKRNNNIMMAAAMIVRTAGEGICDSNVLRSAMTKMVDDAKKGEQDMMDESSSENELSESERDQRADS